MNAKQIAMAEVRSAAVRARHQEVAANQLLSDAHDRLTKAVWEFFSSYGGSLRQMARDMKISAPYLSDVLNGNRKVSDAFVEKLGALYRVPEEAEEMRGDGISQSRKVATIMFNDPKSGRITVQEEPGRVDERLRECIRKSQEVFFREFNKDEAKGMDNAR